MIWMIFGKKNRKELIYHDVENAKKIEDSVLLAQKDHQIRHDLIKKYQPFIAKTASKVCKKYIDPSLDEYSIALQGFNEAIDKFNYDQGSSFLSFAEMVIQRRVIDYIRKEMRQTRYVFLEQESIDEEHNTNSYQIDVSLANYQRLEENERRKADILEYQKQLEEFDITFSDLVKLCPKHMDARENAKQVAKILAHEPTFVEQIMVKKQLPMKELLVHVSCSRKTVERHRKYIVAMALIYIGGYHSLRSYIEPELEGGDIHE